MSLWGLFPKEAVWADKGGEQTPCWGYWSGRKVDSEWGEIAFCSFRTKSGGSHSDSASLSTAKLVWGLLPRGSLEGASLFSLRLQRWQWCNHYCGGVGSLCRDSWTVLEGTFSNLNPGVKECAEGRGGGVFLPSTGRQQLRWPLKTWQLKEQEWWMYSPINSIASLNQELISALWLSSTGMLL